MRPIPREPPLRSSQPGTRAAYSGSTAPPASAIRVSAITPRMAAIQSSATATSSSVSASTSVCQASTALAMSADLPGRASWTTRSGIDSLAAARARTAAVPSVEPLSATTIPSPGWNACRSICSRQRASVAARLYVAITTLMLIVIPES